MRWPWPVALAGSVVTVVLVVAAIAFAALEPTWSTVGWAVVGGAAALLCAGLGALVARRVRDNPVGAAAGGASGSASPTPRRARSACVALAEHDTRPPGSTGSWRCSARARSGSSSRSRCCSSTSRTAACRARRWRVVPSAADRRGGCIHHAYGAVDTDAVPPPRSRTCPPRSGPRAARVELLALLADLTLLALARRQRGVAPRAVPPRATSCAGRQLKWLALVGRRRPRLHRHLPHRDARCSGSPRWASLVVGIAALVGIPIAIAIAMLRARPLRRRQGAGHTVAYVLATAVLLAIFAAASFAGGLLLGRGSTAGGGGRDALVRRSRCRRCAADCSGASTGASYPLRQAALAAIEELQRGHPRRRGAAGAARRSAARRAARSRASRRLRDPGRAPGSSTSGVAARRRRARCPVVSGRHAIGALLPGRRRPLARAPAPGRRRPARRWSSSCACGSS